MRHDPFYSQIINRLDGELDPEQFEACAVDLLRGHDGHFAVPIRGGSDDGMDGAVADMQGQPYPIIATISEDAIGNMTRNLRRYLESGGNARKCIVATPRKLSKKRRENLQERAKELGFTLLQILEQDAVAARLYRDSKWCKALLGLTGQPSALSVVPATRRPLPSYQLELVGRAEAREWLESSRGDRLLVGEPGAGKTSLLYEYALREESGALFVVSSDLGEIANALRDQEPRVLIVDDAQVDSEFLTHLTWLRRELDADFEIVAACWPGDRSEIKQLLSAAGHAHELDRLTADDMTQVVNRAGIGGNTWLVHEIVGQAAGLPGLAVTLADLAQRGQWQKIYTGEALADDIRRNYRRIVGSDVTGLLAAFSLGGESGLDKAATARTLGMPVLDLRRDLASLAQGGIIAEVPHWTDHIKIRPAALRQALIRDVFFSGPDTLPESCLRQLLDQAPDKVASVRELIDVKRRWGDVPTDLIRDRLERLPRKEDAAIAALFSYSPGPDRRTLDACRDYAWLGRQESNWVMNHLGADSIHVARPLLEYVPERVIPRLLDEAIGDARPLNSNPYPPLRLLEDWIMQAIPGTPEPLRRRSALQRAAQEWLAGGGDADVGCRAMLFAMNPGFRFSESEPGGNRVKFYDGLLGSEDLSELPAIWRRIMDFTKDVPIATWDPFLDAIEPWAYPRDAPDAESSALMRSFAAKMAEDVAAAAAERPAVRHKLTSLMSRSQINFEMESDDVASILYPTWDDDDWQGKVEKQQRALESLSRQWSSRSPADVLEELTPLERDMQHSQFAQERHTPVFCHLIANAAPNPLSWFDVFRASALPTDMIIPFLHVAIERAEEGWQSALESAYADDRLRAAAFVIILSIDSVPPALRSRALRDAADFPGAAESVMRRDKPPQSTILALLDHENRSLAGRVAMEFWIAHRKHGLPAWARANWEEAIMGYDGSDRLLADFLQEQPNLGLRWLESKITSQSILPLGFKTAVAVAAASLSVDERRRLIRLCPGDYWGETIARELVGGDPDLYKTYLALADRERNPLAPLSRHKIDATWMKLAKMASAQDHADLDIIAAAFAGVTSSNGKLSAVWKKRFQQFEAFLDDSDPVVKRIAQAGCVYYCKQYEKERQRERDEEVYGSDRR